MELRSSVLRNVLKKWGMLAGALTSLALIELLENLSTSIDSKNITVGVFIDLKRSFDTINYSILIRKLEFYEISGKAFKLG